MNSTEHKQVTTPNNETSKAITIPTESEISGTIDILVNKIRLIDLSVNENFDIREGCVEAIEILRSKRRFYHEISETVVTDKGWAIALLAIDYLNGDLDGKIFDGLPVH